MNLGIEFIGSLAEKRKERERAQSRAVPGYESSREGWFDKCKEEVGLI